MTEPRDIEKDKAMCDLATAGPWRWREKSGREGGGWFHVGDLERPTSPMAGDLILVVERNEIHCWFESNRDFIAESRTALPYYITQYEAQQARIAELEEREFNHYPIIIAELESRIFKFQEELSLHVEVPHK